MITNHDSDTIPLVITGHLLECSVKYYAVIWRHENSSDWKFHKSGSNIPFLYGDEETALKVADIKANNIVKHVVRIKIHVY